MAAMRLVRVFPSKARRRAAIWRMLRHREDVGTRVDVGALQLLGGHVLEGAHDRALLGEGLGLRLQGGEMG